MNTITTILLALLTVGYFVLMILLFIEARKEKDKGVRRIKYAGAWTFIIFGILALVTSLNYYGIARIPLLNTIKKRLPETYMPVEPVTPPVNGSVQPPSKPAFEDHQREMERIKREGLN